MSRQDDIIEIIKYLIESLVNSNATVDDIDHLSNRRVRTVGEQLANQFSIGLARMNRTIREQYECFVIVRFSSLLT